MGYFTDNGHVVLPAFEAVGPVYVDTTVPTDVAVVTGAVVTGSRRCNVGNFSASVFVSAFLSP